MKPGRSGLGLIEKETRMEAPAKSSEARMKARKKAAWENPTAGRCSMGAPGTNLVVRMMMDCPKELG